MRHGNLALFVPHLGCPHRCSFCDQRAITGVQRLPAPEDVRALCKEAAQKTGRSLELAFFGGSFTCIDRQSLLSLLEAARPFLGAGISGIRISTRPDAVEGEMLSLLKARGVTAIELGAQSMSDAVLKKNGRGHSARDVAEAAERVRGFGFELGLQMMLGLDGAEESDDLATARALIACRPDTVRLYPALVLRGTGLAERMRRGEYRPLTLEEGVRRTARVMELFGEAPDIRIIRVGLHPSRSLEEKLLAGPYHPAFRELCEGELMLSRLLRQIGNGDLSGRTVTVAAAPGELSRMLGQKRCNAAEIERRGARLRVVERAGRPPLSPLLLSIT